MSTASQKPLWALKETLATERRSEDVWFRFWTVIGPCATREPRERALFKSRDDAMGCSAYLHDLSFYEPVEVGHDALGDLNWNRS